MFNWNKSVSFVTTTLLALLINRAIFVNALPSENNRSLFDRNSSSCEFCTSKACINAAHMILKNLDTSVDPCDDFNRFACGNFLENNRIPDDQTSLETLDELRITLSHRVSDQLEKPIEAKELEATANSKRFYQSCMNETNIELNAEKQFLDVLNNEFGGWPILNSTFNSERAPVVDMLIRYVKRDQRPILSFGVTPNPKIPGQHALGASQPAWFMSKKYYEDEKIVRAYKQYMTTMAEYMGASQTNAGQYKQEIEDMFKLENEFASLLQTEEEKRNIAYTEYTIKELDEKLPEFQWKKMIIDGIYSEIQPQINVTENEKVLAFNWEYLEQAAKLFASAAVTRRK